VLACDHGDGPGENEPVWQAEVRGVYPEQRDYRLSRRGVGSLSVLPLAPRGGEGFTDFTSRRHWYDTYLLKGKDGRHEIAYETQLDWVKRAFTSAGVVITKITHAGRGQDARETETRDATEFDIRRARRWNSDTMSNAYLSSFLRSAIKVLAGFDVNFQANYHPPRAKEELSEELAR
jgi:hypothetical protein